MAIQQTKISEEELKEMETFQQLIGNLTYQLGQLALKELNLQEEKKILEDQYHQMIKQETALGNKLREKYGADTQIDLKTGEIIQSK